MRNLVRLHHYGHVDLTAVTNFRLVRLKNDSIAWRLYMSASTSYSFEVLETSEPEAFEVISRWVDSRTLHATPQPRDEAGRFVKRGNGES